MTQLAQQPTTPTTHSSGNTSGGRSHGLLLVVLVLAVLVFAGAFSVARRFSEKKALAAETERLAIPTVSVLKPAAEPASDELVLPAQLQAYVDSSIYARTNGYLLRWYKDIGSKVSKGELLADIDAPEVDQE